MKKWIDGLLAVCLGVFMLFLWGYKMMVSSGIPVRISTDEFVLMTTLLALPLMIYLFYLKKTSLFLTNFLLILISAFLWFVSMQQALTFQYQEYDTVISIFGFLVSVCAVVQTVYYKIRRLNNKTVQ